MNEGEGTGAPLSDHLIMRTAQDVKSGYALFLLRLPDSDDHIQGWLGKSLPEMAQAFLGSVEFGYAIAPKLAAAPGSQPTFSVVSGEVALLFRYAMVRFCGLEPAKLPVGMTGWRWALFWVLNLPELRSIAIKIAVSSVSLLQALSTQVTWDVYGQVEAPNTGMAMPEAMTTALPEVGKVSHIDSFGFSGQVIVPPKEATLIAGDEIQIFLAGQKLWPVFVEREASPHSGQAQTRFLVAFDHIATGRIVKRGIEDILRTLRRQPESKPHFDFVASISKSSREAPHRAIGSITTPQNAQNLEFWAGLFDLDIDVGASANRDLLVTNRAHWTASTAVPKLIAFYLPQFYPLLENNEAWGEGFTEWTNVVSAPKLFPEHASPLIPADLGFYDLRTREVRERQAELALQYGLFGFCYYFYWFNGRQVMTEVLQRILRDGEPSLPFCLCWANENWSRRWDGSEDDIIIAQSHDAHQDAAILDDLAKFFDDPRYIRIDGAPLFLIYHLSLMPQPALFLLNLRKRAAELGFPNIILAGVLSHGETDPLDFGCDFGVQFPPHEMGKTKINPKSIGASDDFSGLIHHYVGAGEAAFEQNRGRKVFPGVMPRWDNSARRGKKAHLFYGATPGAFQSWLRVAIARTSRENPEAPFVFINSWNEWAEGAVLEPDKFSGRAYLEAMREAVSTPAAMDPDHPAKAGELDRIENMRNEHKFLGSWLAQHLPLIKHGPLQSGLPPVCSDLPTLPGHACRLEAVNDQSKSVPPAFPSGTSFTLTGWSVGDSSMPSLYRYLIVEDERSLANWHVPCPNRQQRNLASAGVQTAEGEMAGFEIGFTSLGLPRGQYKLSILDITAQACRKTTLVEAFTIT